MDLISCPLCLKPHFNGVDSLRTTLISAATSRISCPVCNETLMGLDKLTIHLFSHITSNIAQEKKKETQADVTVEKITTVLNKPEDTPKTLRCDICNFSFSDENILEMHQKLLHQTLADKTTGQCSYHCHLCSKKFKMRGSLMVHLRVAHYGFGHHNETGIEKLENLVGEAKRNCCRTDEKCDESKSAKQWSCDVCSKLFTTKYFLKKHKRLHTGEMPYFCSTCNKYFTFQQSYHKHMLYHSSEKPHVCTECGRAFKELSTLHNHERIHSGERPFACETCGKCFRQRVSYLVHRRIHTGVMPYKCTACEKTFRYKVSQKSHKCPMSPPGCVIRTNITEIQATSNPSDASVSLIKQAPEATVLPAAIITTGGFVNPNLNTIVFNARGEIIGQNFAFDGGSLITYPNIQNCDISKLNDVDEDKTTTAPTSSGEGQNDLQTDHCQYAAENNNPDFFSMVMSPPLPNVESLCLSNPEPDLQQEKLETINETSLKELLYGQTTNR